MPDHEFFKRPDFVALRTAFSEKSDEEIWKMVSFILPIRGPRQSWVAIDGAHETLDKMKDNPKKTPYIGDHPQIHYKPDHRFTSLTDIEKLLS